MKEGKSMPRLAFGFVVIGMWVVIAVAGAKFVEDKIGHSAPASINANK